MLDKRLLTAASLVRPGRHCVDVGTDHGYLAVYLVESGIAAGMIACDLNEKPLSAAKKSCEAAGLAGRITLLRSDGLADVPAESAQEILICGMGGELILRILTDCPYAKDPHRHFILQPMTRADTLRRGLLSAGFSIEREAAAVEGDHCYTVLSVYYTGQICREVSPFFALVGKIPEDPSPEATRYLAHQRKKQQAILAGLRLAGKTDPQGEALLRELDACLKERTPCQP